MYLRNIKITVQFIRFLFFQRLSYIYSVSHNVNKHIRKVKLIFHGWFLKISILIYRGVYYNKLYESNCFIGFH